MWAFNCNPSELNVVDGIDQFKIRPKAITNKELKTKICLPKKLQKLVIKGKVDFRDT